MSGPFHQIGKLADVARPLSARKLAQIVRRGFRHEGEPQLVLLFPQKKAHQRRNVLPTFPQRRQVQRKHIEAIVQVPAELSLAHPLGQIAVRGRKNADVEMNAVAAAEAFHVLVFQHAQQLGLRSRRKFAYFVEKERAAACAFKAPLLQATCAREGVGLVSEEFVFQKIGGNGRAVHLDTLR